MHELPALGVNVDRARVAVRPAVADAQHEIGRQQRRIAVTVAGLQADHPDHQRVIVRNCAPAHQRGNDRHAGDLGEFDQQRRCVGIDDAAARHDQRTLGIVEHAQRFVDLRPGRPGLVDRQRFVGLIIELDLRHLDVERQVDQHGSGTAGAHQVKCLLEDARDQRRLAYRHRPLGDRFRNRLDVHRLKIFLVQPRSWRLSGDAENGDRVCLRGIQTGDHVRSRRARRADANADVPGPRPRVAFGHVRRALHVAGEHMRNAPAALHRGVQRVDRGARNPECVLDAFPFHHAHGRFSRRHFRHG